MWDDFDKIQSEIEKDLLKESEIKIPEKLHETTYELTKGTADFEAFKYDDVAATSIPPIEYAESAKPSFLSEDSEDAKEVKEEIMEKDTERIEYEGFKPNNNGKPPFVFNEEVKVKAKDKFKRTVAAACIVSILGGSSLGIGVGVISPVINGYINKSQAAEEAPKAETVFAVNDIETPNINPVVINPSFSNELAIYDFVGVIEKVEPSVVSIVSVSQTTENFFGTQMEQPNAGSGIIFKEDDENVYIATNYHVIGGASSVKVSVCKKDVVPAKLVGREPSADLAVIYVSKADLKKVGVDKVTLATFGNSDKTQVGEVVLAIGNALGEGNTATNGIISAKDKEINVEGKTLKVLQTNAAINPGNSGGPLVNMNGEVIGINTAKLARGGVSSSAVEGMGYSIPSNVANPIISQFMNQGSRPFLGIMGGDVTEEMAKMYNLPQAGVLVESVVKDSAAELAGVERYDIITSFNDKPVFTWEHLTKAISECKVGDKVKINVLRDGKDSVKLEATLKTNPDNNF